MRDAVPLLRSGPALVAAAVALGPAAGPAAAGPGISASADGSTVSVTTSACGQVDGGRGTASLLGPGRTRVDPGRRSSLTGTAVSQSAAWRGVRPGMYTVIVVCADNITAGTQSVVVPAPPAPTAATTPTRPHVVMGGPGDGTGGHGTVHFAVGAALAGVALIAVGWVLHRRPRPYRL
jgi:hypothetical protein